MAVHGHLVGRARDVHSVCTHFCGSPRRRYGRGSSRGACGHHWHWQFGGTVCHWLAGRQSGAHSNTDVDAVLDTYAAKIVDQDGTSITIEATGEPGKLADLLKALEKFGVIELVQSGLVALERGSSALSDRTLSPQSVPTADDGGQADYQN